MKQILLSIMVATCVGFAPNLLQAGEEGSWQTDYQKALSTAKAEKKQVLLDFTGSDWCIWCKRLDGEIFSKQEFKQYADKNLVLVKLDFPHSVPQTPAVKEQNEKLAKEFHIEGFPTVIVLDPEGKKVGELGYMEGGPEAFVAKLKELPKS